MKNVKYILTLCLLTILAVSCDYNEPLPGLSNRVGTYTGLYSDGIHNVYVEVAEDSSYIYVRIPIVDDDDDDDTTTTSIDSTDDSDDDSDSSNSGTTYIEYPIATYGESDMRYDYMDYTYYEVRVIFDAGNFDTCYLYTNAYYNDEVYFTCTK